MTQPREEFPEGFYPVATNFDYDNAQPAHEADEEARRIIGHEAFDESQRKTREELNEIERVLIVGASLPEDQGPILRGSGSLSTGNGDNEQASLKELGRRLDDSHYLGHVAGVNALREAGIHPEIMTYADDEFFPARVRAGEIYGAASVEARDELFEAYEAARLRRQGEIS